MVGHAALMHRGDHAHGHAERDAEQGGDARELEGRRKHAPDVLQHRVRGQHRFAEVALEHLADIDQELLPERQMQAELDLDPLVHVGRRPVADRGQHGIDRHHPTDHERDHQQAEEGERERGDQAQDGAQGPRQSHRLTHLIAPLSDAVTTGSTAGRGIAGAGMRAVLIDRR